MTSALDSRAPLPGLPIQPASRTDDFAALAASCLATLNLNTIQ